MTSRTKSTLRKFNILSHYSESDEDRKIEQLIKEQKHNFGINSYEKAIVTSNDLGINVNGDKTKKTSRWKVEKTLSK